MAKKLYYKIGEACKMLGIQPYVLRYWETEFQALSPTKSKSGQRVYSDQDLAVIRRIKELLYDEGYTIAGAKKQLAEGGPLEVGELEEKSAAESMAEPKKAPVSGKKAPARRKAAAKTASSPVEEIAEAEEKVGGVTSLADPATQRALRAALDEARELLALLDA